MCKGSAAGGSRISGDLREIQRLELRFQVVGKEGGRVRGNWRHTGSAHEVLANAVKSFALYLEVLGGTRDLKWR